MNAFTRRHVLTAFPAALTLRAAAPAYQNVQDHGADASGKSNTTKAIQRAIDAAAGQGGGTVLVPAGQYLCGTLRLKSHVSMWLDNGSVLVMSPEAADFAPPEQLAFDPQADRATSYFRNALLAGEEVEDIAIFGQGAVEGNRTRGGGPKPLSFKRCRNLSIRGITIRNAPSYNISLLGCDYVEIDGVTIRNGFSDGIDPDCCKFVRISNCFVESVDDAIVLKASPALGKRVSTEHVTVTNCVLRTASIHLKTGTESFGDFQNIAFSNCVLVGGMGMRHGNPGIALYTVDGGNLRGVTVSNITMQNVGVPLALRLGARGRGQQKPAPGVLEDILFSNIVATGAQRTSAFCGIPGHPLRNISMSDVRITVTRSAEGLPMDQVPEKPADYPDPTMFGELPAYGMYWRHCSDVTLRNVSVDGAAEDKRPAFLAEDAERLELFSFRSRTPANRPAVWLHNSRASALLDCRFSSGEHAVRLSGGVTRDIGVRGVRAADVERMPEVDAKAIREL